MRKAFVTKVRPGSISEAIRDKLFDLGYEVVTPGDNWNILDGFKFPKDCQVMVNTAGVTDTAKPGEWDWEKANKVISVNLTGAAVLTSDFVKATAGTPWVKTIIHLGSLWSRKHATNSAIYCASKAGLAHYIACMGYDLNLHHPGEYTIIGLHPGNVQGTPMTKKVKSKLITERGFTMEQVEALYEGAITPADIADVVEKVLGNQWLNGENIYLPNGDKR